MICNGATLKIGDCVNDYFSQSTGNVANVRRWIYVNAQDLNKKLRVRIQNGGSSSVTVTATILTNIMARSSEVNHAFAAGQDSYWDVSANYRCVMLAIVANGGNAEIMVQLID